LLGAHLVDFLFAAGPRGDGFATIDESGFPTRSGGPRGPPSHLIGRIPLTAARTGRPSCGRTARRERVVAAGIEEHQLHWRATWSSVRSTLIAAHTWRRTR